MEVQPLYWTTQIRLQCRNHDNGWQPDLVKHKIQYHLKSIASGFTRIYAHEHRIYISDFSCGYSSYHRCIGILVNHLELIQSQVGRKLELVLKFCVNNSEYVQCLIQQAPKDLIQTLILKSRLYPTAELELAKASGKFEQVGVRQPYVEVYNCRWSLQSHRYQSVAVRNIVEWFMIFESELPREILYLIYSLL